MSACNFSYEHCEFLKARSNTLKGFCQKYKIKADEKWGCGCDGFLSFFFSPPAFHSLDKWHVPSLAGSSSRSLPAERGPVAPGSRTAPGGTQPQAPAPAVCSAEQRQLLSPTELGQTLPLVPMTATPPKALCQG